MIAVWYDTTCDAIWVSFVQEPFLPRSLMADRDGDTVTIWRCYGTTAVLAAPYSQIVRRDGTEFASAANCLAYLRGEFARAPGRVPSVTAVASAPVAAGFPVALSRVSGAAQVARADTYPLAFVAGLAPASADPGFPVEAVRSSVTLADWTACAGAPSLTLGQPYFLGPTGGITLTPDRTPGMSLTRIGLAADPQTLVFTPSDPILL
ncbi:hypothetical protein [Methylobacterium sp. Gmos1]